MTENEAKLEKMIAEDYKAVLHEAKSMGCNNIKALYHIPLKNMELIIKALEEVQQYRAIGTPEECRAAMEKQTAISREIIEGKYFCPKCHKPAKNAGYCVCGQKLY